MSVFFINNQSDRTLLIDPAKREILIPKCERVFGVHSEFGVEKKYFKCPKIIGNNIDLSRCYIFVNYISSSGKYGQTLCPDVEETADACITFSWELTENVFDENKDATIYFSVQAKRLNDEGKLGEVFSTKIAQGKSYATIDATPKVQEAHADIIVQILGRVDKLEKGSGSGELTTEEFEKAFADYLTDHKLAKMIETDDTLKVTEDGKLAVNTTTDMAADNTRPITSGGVYTQVGNINALLETI